LHATGERSSLRVRTNEKSRRRDATTRKMILSRRYAAIRVTRRDARAARLYIVVRIVLTFRKISSLG